MDVLNKILEEIDSYLYEKYCIENDEEIEKIIRSHMDEVPYCGNCSRRKWYQIGYKDCENNIKNNGWISVKERLPIGRVLVQDDCGKVIIGYAYEKCGEYRCFTEDNEFHDIVAWMPLESYEGE